MSPYLCLAGDWLVRSGIQEENGGAARYYVISEARNKPVSTEITGYAAGAFLLLYRASGNERYLERACAAARFLTRTAWNPQVRAMPFEMGEPAYSYFFDCGIIVRSLLAVWRATRDSEFLEGATSVAESMLRFAHDDGTFHPIVSLPDWRPTECDRLRWSRAPGCYQLKAAAAWRDLADAAGSERWLALYDSARENALRDSETFLPGHSDRGQVMDRLHPYLYFLEGLLPCAQDQRCAAAILEGIARVERLYYEIAPEFERADVLAQLFRMRLYAGAAVPDFEATRLLNFQASEGGLKVDGGFYFGRKAGGWVPHVSVVPTVFAIQALDMWERRRAGAALPAVHDLI